MGQREWISELDGVRGLAVLLVVAHHLAPWERLALPGTGVFAAGWAGVDLFFVLSGFLITGILLDTREHPAFWRNFVIRRALRILPLYWVVMGAMLLVRMAEGGETAAPAWAYLLFLANWWIGTLPSFTDLRLNISWSLCIEEQFYLTWPLLVRALTHRQLAYAIVLPILLAPVARVFVGTETIAADMWTLCRMDAIAWGCAAALVMRAGDRWVRAVARAALPLAALTAAWFLALGFDRDALAFRIVGFSLLLAAIAALLIALRAGNLPIVREILIARPLVWVGTVSFGVYLVHPFVIVGVHQALSAVVAPLSPTLALLAYPFAATAASCALAGLSFWIFERPILSLKERLAPYAPPDRA